MATRVIIVRHGQSSYNAQQRIQGRSDQSVLTEKGQLDAKTVGKSLSGLGIDEIFCSPLQRAKSTAQIIQSCFASPPSLTATPDLLEIDLALWENWYKKDVIEKFPEDYQCWKKSPQNFKMTVTTPEGEKETFPVVDLYQQAQNFWQKLLSEHQNKTLLIVAHNGINRCLIMSAISVPVDNYHRVQQSNCNINVLNFTGNWGDPVQLESLNQTSHLGMAIPSLRKADTPLRLLLIRHGETEWNRESRFQGIRDIPLNDNGRGQAKKAGDFLKDIPIDLAISSPMLRPKETAEIVLQYHPNVTLDLQSDLMEIGHGLWEGKLESEIEADFPGLLNEWKTSPETVQMPEGENLQQVWDRAIACWDERVAYYSALPEKSLGIVVAHDAINKVIVCHLLGLSPANFWNIKQGNGGVTVIDYPDGPDGAPVLQAINITTHLGDILDKTAAGAL